MTDSQSSKPIKFDFDEWLESVEGKTVRVTAPDENQLGHEAARLFTSPSMYVLTWCENCEDHHCLVKTDSNETVGHCPRCGRQPGALELGTKQKP